MALAFLADENVEIDVVDRLKSLGHTAVHASELSPGRPDAAVLQAASRAGQVLITNDKDFGEKVYRERRPHRGVVFLRLEDERTAKKIDTIRRLLEGHADRLADRFVVVTETQVRFAQM